MAAIVRVKRRREDDVVDSLVLLCKKAKSSTPSTASTECSVEEVKSVFKFAGTVTAKEGTVATQCVSQAIRKAKLQKQYKLTEGRADARARAELRKSDASCSRYQIIAERRALDFASLANDYEASSSTASRSLDTDVSSNKTDSTQAPNSRIFCLYDVEKLEFKSVSQIADAAAASSTITCNNIPLIREKVAPPCRMPSLAVPEEVSTSDEMDHYVYDVYYMNDSQFDFKAFENVLAVESYKEETQFMYDCASDEDEDEAGYDDDDDENAENNWRNDYPDHDPMYFERLHLDDNYSSDDESVDRFYKDDEDRDDKY